MYDIKRLTVALLTLIDGLAEAYSRNSRFIPMPITIPSSNLMNKQLRKVATAGTRSISNNDNDN